MTISPVPDVKRSEVRRSFLFLILFAALISFAGLHCREIYSGDESRVAGISVEMFLESDYLVPHLNDQAFLEYPGLYYYLQCLAFKLFGIHDYSAKLPSALALFGSALVCFWLVLRLNRKPQAALLSSIFLLTSAQFWANGRTCMVDILLAFFILVSLYGFISWDGCRRNIGWFLLFALGMGAGVMTKGLTGLLFPIAVAGAWSLICDLEKRKFDYLRYAVLAAGLLLSLIPVGIWCHELYVRKGEEAFWTVFWVNNFGRFYGEQGDHVVPFYYYLKRIPEWFQPYLILLPFGLWYAAVKVKRERNKDLLFLLCYFVVPYLILTLASSKRQVYLLPLTIPAAILCGNFVAAIWSNIRVRAFSPYVLPVLTAILVLVSAILLFFAPGWFWIYPLLAIVAGGVFFCTMRRENMAFAAFLVSLALTYTSFDASFYARLNKVNSLRKMFEYCRRQEALGKKIYILTGIERLEGGAYYYMHRNLPLRMRFDKFDPERELWIFRDRKGKWENKFADSHFVEPASAALQKKYARSLRKEK